MAVRDRDTQASTPKWPDISPGLESTHYDDIVWKCAHVLKGTSFLYSHWKHSSCTIRHDSLCFGIASLCTLFGVLAKNEFDVKNLLTKSIPKREKSRGSFRQCPFLHQLNMWVRVPKTLILSILKNYKRNIVPFSYAAWKSWISLLNLTWLMTMLPICDSGPLALRPSCQISKSSIAS